jgi:cysteinyl-tRNA synthetase
MPEVIALVWKIAKISPVTVLEMDKVLGLSLDEEIVCEKIPSDILELMEERKEARNKKDWGKSDLLREKIEKRGYVVEDLQNNCKIRKVMLI